MGKRAAASMAICAGALATAVPKLAGWAARGGRSRPPVLVIGVALLVLGGATAARALNGPAVGDWRRWLTLAAALGLLAASAAVFVSVLRRRADG